LRPEIEARDGCFWFATHHHGACRMKDGAFTHFGTADGVEGVEAWDLFADRAGNVWFPTENYGVYRFDGESFRRFGEEDGLLSPAVQCTFEDREGRIWVGGYSGLYRYDGDAFVNLGERLPWPQPRPHRLPKGGASDSMASFFVLINPASL
jgi:ligand-binding sensor domain-containing protein